MNKHTYIQESKKPSEQSTYGNNMLLVLAGAIVAVAGIGNLMRAMGWY